MNNSILAAYANNSVFAYSPRDLREAIPDYLAAKLGANIKNLHPLAERMLNDSVKFKDIAIAFHKADVEAKGQRFDASQPVSKMVGAAMTTSDFADSVSKAIGYLVRDTYDVNAKEHRSLCKMIPVTNFQSVSFPTLDGSDNTTLLREAREVKRTPIAFGQGVDASLSTWVQGFLLTRELIINDQLDLAAGVISRAVAALARTEAKQIYSLIEANPAMGDGQAMFGASNTVTGNMDTTGLASAMAALRNQPTPAGNYANNRASILLVPPALEHAALSLVKAISYNDALIEVIAAPWLTSATTWYMLADPAASPVIGMLYLEGGADSRTVRVEGRRADIKQDGVGIVALSDFGTVNLDRVGIVKVAA